MTEPAPLAELTPVPRKTSPVLEQLERCRPFLEPVLEATPWEELSRQVASGHAQLWPGESAAMVTRVIGDTLEVWLGGGDLKELLQLQDGVAAFGRSMGCSRATIEGRAGWGRVLKTNGWAASFVTYERPL
ncbi:hypothetical protein [Methylocaldum sp.]|uniref:hypothetical protein n=1 Tax=Methylocaldum sp. TaxID=1969727 RepID=UPI002D5B38BA|nr:hypothetical protein [Methylocaldum sp.]HYE38227.1 hypothetical protein [Methylocaldum sp.]